MLGPQQADALPKKERRAGHGWGASKKRKAVVACPHGPAGLQCSFVASSEGAHEEEEHFTEVPWAQLSELYRATWQVSRYKIVPEFVPEFIRNLVETCKVHFGRP